MWAPVKRSVAGESGTSYRGVVRAEYEASRNRVLVNIDRHVFGAGQPCGPCLPHHLPFDPVS